MTTPLVEKAANHLLKLIIEREYEVGDRLPNEYDLAQDLDVGRSTVREAVRSLVARNILEVRQGSGTYVSSKKGVSEDPLGFALVKDTAKLTNDLFELRYLLEPHIAAKVAMVATDAEIAELESLVERIENSITDGTDIHFELDVEFHSLMAKLSQNIAMNSLLPIIYESIHLINLNYTNHQMKEDTLHAHRAILNGIKSRDALAAHEAMQWHILTVKNSAVDHDELSEHIK